jgi:hypothetical protein
VADPADVPETWRLCKRCAVAGVCTPASHTVPSGPPRFDPQLACAEHAAPYKTKKPLTLATKDERL